MKAPGSHETETQPSPGVAITPVGASGTVAGMAGLDGAEGAEVPTALVAVTSKV